MRFTGAAIYRPIKVRSGRTSLILSLTSRSFRAGRADGASGSVLVWWAASSSARSRWYSAVERQVGVVQDRVLGPASLRAIRSATGGAGPPR